MVELTCIIPSKQFIVATLAGLWTKTAKNQIETKVFSLPVQDGTGIFKQWMILCQVCMYVFIATCNSILVMSKFMD